MVFRPGHFLTHCRKPFVHLSIKRLQTLSCVGFCIKCEKSGLGGWRDRQNLLGESPADVFPAFAGESARKREGIALSLPVFLSGTLNPAIRGQTDPLFSVSGIPWRYRKAIRQANVAPLCILSLAYSGTPTGRKAPERLPPITHRPKPSRLRRKARPLWSGKAGAEPKRPAKLN